MIIVVALLLAVMLTVVPARPRRGQDSSLTVRTGIELVLADRDPPPWGRCHRLTPGKGRWPLPAWTLGPVPRLW